MRLLMLIAAGAIAAFQGAGVDQAAAALDRGEAFLRGRKFVEAIREFKQANDLLGKKSAEALYGLCRTYFQSGDYKRAADVCRDGLAVAGADRVIAASLHNQRGVSLVAQAQRNSDRVIKDAEVEFREVLALTDTMPIARYNLAVMLFRQMRDDEGRAALQAFLESGAAGPEVELAKKMMSDPRRAREVVAPGYSATALDGKRVSSADFAGKIVLLDFWGTWCKPCLAATQDLVRIHRKYADDGRFVMIGISSDPPKDQANLIDYIRDNDMRWVQVHDMPGRAFHRAFDVNAFPTYILIDGGGFIVDMSLDGRPLKRLVGWDKSVPGAIEDGIRRAMKLLTPSASSPGSFALLVAPGSSSR